MKAEASKTQQDVTAALELVNALSEGEAKTNLLARIAVVQGIINDALTKQQQQAGNNCHSNAGFDDTQSPANQG